MAIIQVRGVSPRTHKRLRAKAAKQGQSLSEFLRAELEQFAELPTLDEVLDRVATRKPVGGEEGATAVRAGRAERGAS